MNMTGPKKNLIKNFTFAVVALSVLLEIFAWSIPILTHLNVTSNLASVVGSVMTELTNEERTANSLQTLTVSSKLNQAAQMKAADMAANGYFAHTSPEGKTPWYWLDQVGYNYDYAGENLAINFSDSKDVVEAWMNSPTHEANIVKGSYTEIGTGVAEGIYQGRKTIFVAQVYAHPIVSSADASNLNKPKEATQQITKNTVPGQVLGAEISVTQPTFWQKWLASPESTARLALYIIFTLITLVLVLYIFIKSKEHDKVFIRNGLLILFFIALMFAYNYYLGPRLIILR